MSRSAAVHVASLNTRLVIKEAIDWVGYERVAVVAAPGEVPLAAIGQLRLWLEGEVVPADVEARLRALLQIVLILEPRRGLAHALEVLDRPMPRLDVRVLLCLAVADQDLIDVLIQGAQEAADEL